MGDLVKKQGERQTRCGKTTSKKKPTSLVLPSGGINSHYLGGEVH